MSSNTKLTTDGDLDFSGNSILKYVSASDQRLQRLRTKIKHFFGTWFLNNQSGFDWYGEVFIKSPNISKIKRDFMDYILEIPGIESFINDPVFEPDSVKPRQLNITFAVLDEDGIELNVNETI